MMDFLRPYGLGARGDSDPPASPHGGTRPPQVKGSPQWYVVRARVSRGGEVQDATFYIIPVKVHGGELRKKLFGTDVEGKSRYGTGKLFNDRNFILMGEDSERMMSSLRRIITTPLEKKGTVKFSKKNVDGARRRFGRYIESMTAAEKERGAAGGVEVLEFGYVGESNVTRSVRISPPPLPGGGAPRERPPPVMEEPVPERV